MIIILINGEVTMRSIVYLARASLPELGHSLITK